MATVIDYNTRYWIKRNEEKKVGHTFLLRDNHRKAICVKSLNEKEGFVSHVLTLNWPHFPYLMSHIETLNLSHHRLG